MGINRRTAVIAAGSFAVGAVAARGVSAVYARLRAPVEARPPPRDWSGGASARLATINQGPVRQLRFAMLGDSLTDLARWSTLLGVDGIGEFGVAGAQARELLPLVERAAASSPQRIFLQIGINDLLYRRSVADTARDVADLALTLQRIAPVTLTSVLPIEKGLGPPTMAAEIAAVNDQIRALAGVTYVDLHAQLRDAEGWIRPEFTTDGLHLTAAAYALWAAAVRPSLG